MRANVFHNANKFHVDLVIFPPKKLLFLSVINDECFYKLI